MKKKKKIAGWPRQLAPSAGAANCVPRPRARSCQGAQRKPFLAGLRALCCAETWFRRWYCLLGLCKPPLTPGEGLKAGWVGARGARGAGYQGGFWICSSLISLLSCYPRFLLIFLDGRYQPFLSSFPLFFSFVLVFFPFSPSLLFH